VNFSVKDQGESRMSETESSNPHPEVVRRKGYETWPADKPFPLTPLEAWYVMQGWEVKPASGLTFEQFNELPGKLEGGADWLWLWQS
jgi:hypothetical protein